jgi:methylated-DNA-[protein]-cysteine S-methyltransferase
MLCFDTAIGTCGMRWGTGGVCAILMPGSRGLARQSRPPEGGLEVLASIRRSAEAVVSLLEGEAEDLRWIPLDRRGIDPFRLAVYEATRGIAAGSTATYGEIARAVGEPGAARAVGAALARNPFPIVVPCHRVLAAGGELHGFSAPGGLATKRRLLAIEGAAGFAQQALFAS